MLDDDAVRMLFHGMLDQVQPGPSACELMMRHYQRGKQIFLPTLLGVRRGLHSGNPSKQCEKLFNLEPFSLSFCSTLGNHNLNLSLKKCDNLSNQHESQKGKFEQKKNNDGKGKYLSVSSSLSEKKR